MHAFEFNLTVPPSPSLFVCVMLQTDLIKAMFPTGVPELPKSPGECIWCRFEYLTGTPHPSEKIKSGIQQI